MTYIETWDETSPPGDEAISLGDDRIRGFKRALRERLAADHKFLADETGVTTIGYHLPVHLIDNVTDPAAIATTGIIYAKTSASAIELFFRDASGLITQLTYPGRVQGDIEYYSAANTKERLAKDANATRYLANTGTDNNPKWDLVNLTNGVTGILPVANGGTGRSGALGISQVTGSTDIYPGGVEEDMTDMSITLTTIGTKLLVFFTAPFFAAVDSDWYIKTYIDGVAKYTAHLTGLATNTFQQSMQWLETGLTPGSHTIKIRWYTGSGGLINQMGASGGKRVLTCQDLD